MSPSTRARSAATRCRATISAKPSGSVRSSCARPGSSCSAVISSARCGSRGRSASPGRGRLVSGRASLAGGRGLPEPVLGLPESLRGFPEPVLGLPESLRGLPEPVRGLPDGDRGLPDGGRPPDEGFAPPPRERSPLLVEDITLDPLRPALQHRTSTPKRQRPPEGGLCRKNVRRRPTLPRSHPRSTIGAERLSFRVRNGTGRFPLAMAAETLLRFQSDRAQRYECSRFPTESREPHSGRELKV